MGQLGLLEGTAKDSRINGLSICGKTGTAQNPHGEDHSIFIAFAPKERPKIAIAVYVENAGFGSTIGPSAAGKIDFMCSLYGPPIQL